MSLLLFDSGIGGLSVLREARVILPGRRIVYVGDDAGFPYGEWEEAALTARIVELFERYVRVFEPKLAIVACNTASTLIMPALRARFELPFVGTVPPIKPAAERTASGLVSVLATPGTVRRPYVAELVRTYADACEVTMVGSTRLARMAEARMQDGTLDRQALAEEIRPCFVERGERRTDIVILGCTHYPFLVHEMRKVAPWPVDWLEPAEPIARRALALLGEADSDGAQGEDVAIMTSGLPDAPLARLLAGFGLRARAPLGSPPAVPVGASGRSAALGRAPGSGSRPSTGNAVDRVPS